MVWHVHLYNHPSLMSSSSGSRHCRLGSCSGTEYNVRAQIQGDGTIASSQSSLPSSIESTTSTSSHHLPLDTATSTSTPNSLAQLLGMRQGCISHGGAQRCMTYGTCMSYVMHQWRIRHVGSSIMYDVWCMYVIRHVPMVHKPRMELNDV